jgi:hypothetical protein
MRTFSPQAIIRSIATLAELNAFVTARKAINDYDAATQQLVAMRRIELQLEAGK